MQLGRIETKVWGAFGAAFGDMKTWQALKGVGQAFGAALSSRSFGICFMRQYLYLKSSNNK